VQKSFVVKSSINFANFGFFVRVGDILVHDTANGNKLTVYRNGEIVKAITQTALGMAALLKQGFVSELLVSQRPAAVPASPRAPEAPRKATPAPVPEFKQKDAVPEKEARKEAKKPPKAAPKEPEPRPEAEKEPEKGADL
jgi:hypothetical protein